MNPTRLIKAIEEAGFEVRSYSGRGMYGKTCVGVEGVKSAFALGVQLAIVLGEDADNELSDLWISEDSMGTGKIFYFPGVEWFDGENPEACPGCGCVPGDGRTAGCVDPIGCGFQP